MTMQRIIRPARVVEDGSKIRSLFSHWNPTRREQHNCDRRVGGELKILCTRLGISDMEDALDSTASDSSGDMTDLTWHFRISESGATDDLSGGFLSTVRNTAEENSSQNQGESSSDEVEFTELFI